MIMMMMHSTRQAELRTFNQQ